MKREQSIVVSFGQSYNVDLKMSTINLPWNVNNCNESKMWLDDKVNDICMQKLLKKTPVTKSNQGSKGSKGSKTSKGSKGSKTAEYNCY